MKKITVIGAGFVGGETARRIVENNLADVILLDIVDGLAEGKALDIMQSLPILGFNSKVIGTTDYSLTENSDILIITAGLSRKPGMTREDLLIKNANIVKEIVEKSTVLSPNAILIVVTNPVDIMSYLAFKVSGFSFRKVIGMGGVLDSSRYCYFILEELKNFNSKIKALVLGAHGEDMVPVASSIEISDRSIDKIFLENKIEEINNKTKNAGAQIVNLLKTTSAYYAPSAAIYKMVKCIIEDRKEVLPCSVYLNGEYGLKDIYIGVPVMLSLNGVEKIIEIELTSKEKDLFNKAAINIRKNISLIKDIC